MSGQHRAREVVEAPRAGLAPIPLPIRLRVIAAVANHRCAVAPRAADARWPAVLPYHGEALGIVDQGRKVDQIRCGHDARGSSRGPVDVPRSPSIFSDALQACHPVQNTPTRTTPDPDKSHERLPISRLFAPLILVAATMHGTLPAHSK